MSSLWGKQIQMPTDMTDKALGQENDPMYVAYAVECVMMQAGEK